MSPFNTGTVPRNKTDEAKRLTVLAKRTSRRQRALRACPPCLITAGPDAIERLAAYKGAN